MNLFVDSNIFLDFYHFSSDDLEELGKLAELLRKKEVRLILPRQVINEVRRNRDTKVCDALRIFRDSTLHFRLPQICKSYQQYDVIKRAIRQLKKTKSDLDTALSNDIATLSLRADLVIEELFNLSDVRESDELIDAAQLRYNLGNPPGKDKSYGDAVNWETLLRDAPEGEDLFFISGDKDFSSPLGEGKFNSFLRHEWEEKKNSGLFYYTQLSSFFREHHTDIQLRSEEEKNELIDKLAVSGNFEKTHYLIGELSKFDGFSDSQITQLIDIAISNSQVLWISGDPDVNSFFRSLASGKEHLLDSTVQGEFQSAYVESTEEESGDTDDDQPF